LLFALVQIELARNADDAARVTLTRFITAAPDRATDVLHLAGQLGRAGEAPRAFNCAEVVVDDAVLRSDWERAVDVLQSFLVHGAHVPALVKLVQVAEDAGLDDVVQEAQERLADAYLESGRGTEAQSLAELLFARAPDSRVHTARLRRALELTDVEDPDLAIQQLRHRLDPAATATTLPDDVDTARWSSADALSAIAFEVEPALFDGDVVVEGGIGSGDRSTEQRQEESIEFDLSEALKSLSGSQVTPATSHAASQPMDTSDLDSVFEAMRPKSADHRTVADAAEVYERGRRRLDSGQVKEGLEDLEEAARVPALRFPAAARLGREYVERGRPMAGIEWLERAAAVPAPSREAGLAVLYELGVALDAVGETARALAVLIEIAADDPNYRDVTQRIEILVRAEAERRG
jgi:tetratricopeptide (TPR) repeat protein